LNNTTTVSCGAKLRYPLPIRKRWAIGHFEILPEKVGSASLGKLIRNGITADHRFPKTRVPQKDYGKIMATV